ncbi:hypothetical protein FRZ67_21440 [Panacibacter ginsenosidivorans]|uniref:Uncharacterized protein n=1 Tax=Panacibacter ginsenosidivorans TaxID=1813871 RepID=A0A5B8VGP1_9BACT|nr:hypothetical protein [Panacibacter ginsenosidivorans]QEC69736.1 hypothetical protein FRZ67_21440 [Panacibacter ginsenosidivorans]
MGEDTWRYFVKEPFTDLLSEKPLIFEGSRGCGKTMFFLCNSWKEKFAEYETQGINVTEIFSKTGLIGFYYKVDGKFVGKNLSKKGVEEWEWQSVFNTYFNIIICKDVLNFLSHCIDRGYIAKDEISTLVKRINGKLEFNCDVESLEKTYNHFDVVLDEIEGFSNDPEKKKPLGLHAGTLIATAIEEIRKIQLFNEARFHVFIDEFEELNEAQQKQLNTLLKQSKYWLVYDFGVKTKGRHTEETISGEIIQEPDDYLHYYPEIDSYERKEEYERLLVSICSKRIKDYLPEALVSNDDFLDIRFYLKDYGKEIELKEFEQSSKMPSIRTRLKRLIEEDNAHRHYFDKDEMKEVYNVLVNCTPDLVRMHISILNRRNKVSIKELFENAKSNTKVYQSWKHNTGFATYFLLCKELDIIKKYHGLSTFSMLSSGVIRSFLEICESAFDYAFSEGFTFDNPRSLTIDEQTNAAHYVSQSKVSKIEGFVPDGMHLKRFMLAIGKIFYLKHTDPDATLGEPEPNHFYTKPLELKALSPEALRILENAILHNVLQFDLPTKEKNTEAIETTDYHINHIYCPYFKISHRRKRKIFLEPAELKTLLIGTTGEVEKVVRSIVNKNTESIQGKLNFYGDDLSGEI